MRVYFFNEGRLPRVTTLDEIVSEHRAAGVQETAITTMVFDLDHTGFASGATCNGRYVVINAEAVDKLKGTPSDKPKQRPFLSLVVGSQG